MYDDDYKYDVDEEMIMNELIDYDEFVDESMIKMKMMIVR